MKIEKHDFSDNIYLFMYNNKYDLALSVLRIQEFYECPKFRRKVFTLEEYMDYYCTVNETNIFDYPEQYVGFNIPGKDIIKWVCEYKDIRDKEREILDNVFSVGEELIPKSYFMFCSYDDPDLYNTLRHEVAHSLYKIDKEYRKNCEKIYNSITESEKKKISKFLTEFGYNKTTHKDETQAYFSTGGLPGAIKITDFSCYRKYLNNFKKAINSEKHRDVKNKLESFKI